MDNLPVPNRHTFLSHARPFEPPTASGSAAVHARNRLDHHLAQVHAGSQSGRRRRPFQRSLGNHAHGGTPGSNVVTPAERQASEDAQRGAEHALRLILEILDRRRTTARLGALFTPTVVESLKTLVNSQPPGQSLGAASLRRVHVSRCAKNSAEVFGTYARGPRIFAVAARLEYRKTARHSGWTVTSVRIR
ncbi:hypothetical protein BJD99_07760 [Rhodococcus sp. 1163]|uniref:Rv3235 family protein n=1 Tax=unclassified Rhodococcus (in: high G+C Gram-positive bacteria) TaxID=192944 RepID=UPI0009FFD8AC|nr:Rv3235 family protein [Rhodococcus sp. 1163]ORI15873.1 hypothetical protein BJD99_07760 [Rhodococcus sp. 1163]